MGESSHLPEFSFLIQKIGITKNQNLPVLSVGLKPIGVRSWVPSRLFLQGGMRCKSKDGESSFFTRDCSVLPGI